MIDNGGKTGWPPGLLQDDSRELSKWLASRPEARYLVRQVCAEIVAEKQQGAKNFPQAFSSC